MGLVGRARELRQTATPAEAHVWDWLRNRRLEGLKFRRQHPVGGFILDFYCDELKFGLELEGSVHNADNAAKDLARRRNLESRGITMFYLQNDLVLSFPAEAHSQLKSALPRPTPSPLL